jgi:hypothetical protein
VSGKQILSVSTNPTKQSIEQDNLGSSANSLTSPLNEQISTFLETGSEKPLLTEYNYFFSIAHKVFGLCVRAGLASLIFNSEHKTVCQH